MSVVWLNVWRGVVAWSRTRPGATMGATEATVRDAPQHITPVRRYARESRAQSPTVESVLEMEIDEIKRCAWPWAACTVLQGIGARGPGPWRWRAGGRASTGACGSAYEPSFRARARRRSGSRSRPGGMAERSAGAAPRPGGRVGSHAHAAPLRRVGVWPGQPRSRTWTGIWHACAWPHRVAHRASWAGAWGQLRGAGAALAVAVRSWAGYVVS